MFIILDALIKRESANPLDQLSHNCAPCDSYARPLSFVLFIGPASSRALANCRSRRCRKFRNRRTFIWPIFANMVLTSTGTHQRLSQAIFEVTLEVSLVCFRCTVDHLNRVDRQARGRFGFVLDYPSFQRDACLIIKRLLSFAVGYDKRHRTEIRLHRPLTSVQFCCCVGQEAAHNS